MRLFVLLFALAGFASATALAEPRYRVDFQMGFDLASGEGVVEMRLDQDRDIVRRMDFNMPAERFSAIEIEGDWRRDGDRVIWELPERGGRMAWRVSIERTRANGAFDARLTPDWALFRGDRVFPAARVLAERGARSISRLSFDLPEGWSVETRFNRLPGGVFEVVEERGFQRPTGWMIAGDIGVRRDTILGTEVVVAAPRGQSMRRQDILAFLNWILPEADLAFGRLPPKFLIVGADDPMWRGGLSGPYSMYLHADRPLVSENGTSTLIHELVHSLTRIIGAPYDNWISEGIAEIYTFELIHRAGGSTAERYERARQIQRERAEGVRTVRVRNSQGRVTSRAVVVFMELDEEIRAATDDEKSLDDLVRRLMELPGPISTEQLRAEAEAILGRPSRALQSPVLRRRGG